MHIIIPMSGIGKRFIDTGYNLPKFLIEVENKPVIEHIINLFPNETKFTFICNDEHLKNTNITNILKKIKKDCNIFEVSVNNRKGPVDAVLQASKLIEDDEEIIDKNNATYHIKDFIVISIENIISKIQLPEILYEARNDNYILKVGESYEKKFIYYFMTYERALIEDFMKNKQYLLYPNGYSGIYKDYYDNGQIKKEFFHNKKPWYYKMNTFGYNFRISDINCSLGSSQLLKLNRFVNKVFLIIGSSCP